MRAWELLFEGEKSSLESDIEDLLTAAKASGVTDIETKDLVDQLNSMGHAATVDSIISVIDGLDNEMIDNATLRTITLKTHVLDTDDDEGEDEEFGEEEPDSEEIAKKSAMKSIKKDQKQSRKATKDAQI